MLAQRSIRVWLSTGPRTTTVPELIGQTERTARLRLEQVRSLLNNPELTLEAIAERCGFAGARQLRRVWKAAFGTAPASVRRSQIHSPRRHGVTE